MLDALAIAAVGTTAFASTSIDNLVLLTVLLGQSGPNKRAVLYGFVAAVAAIAVLGLAVARFADAVPIAAIGYLGLVPLTMGLYRLASALRPAPAEAGTSGATALGVGGVAALTASNGADTLSVLLPLFAETPEPLTFVLAGTLIILALAWVWLATQIAGHPWVRTTIAKVERWLVPGILIAVGTYILLDSPTDTLPDEDVPVR